MSRENDEAKLNNYGREFNSQRRGGNSRFSVVIKKKNDPAAEEKCLKDNKSDIYSSGENSETGTSKEKETQRIILQKTMIHPRESVYIPLRNATARPMEGSERPESDTREVRGGPIAIQREKVASEESAAEKAFPTGTKNAERGTLLFPEERA